MVVLPQKTKGTNTFRFKSFWDRVNEIDIRQSALYYIGHENEELPEDDETYFHQTIIKWTALNLTDEYNEFSKKCRNLVTLPQLIHKKDFIIDFLLKKLSTATTLSLQPLLEILVVLAKDLREEFYPYFQRVLDHLICLLNTQEPDQLEWTLICLAFLFKTLKPFLKKNLAIIFNAILPLLDETRWSEQVINFAVECFAFIARDISNPEKLLDMIIKNVEREGMQGVNGCGRLFFEIVRSVNGNFHSSSSTFLPFIFESLLNSKYDNKSLLYEIVNSTVLNILAYIHPHNMNVYWKAICQAIDKSLDSDNDNSIKYLIELTGISIEYKDGKLLTDLEGIVSCMLKVSDKCDEKEEVLEKTSLVICSILLSTNAKVSQLDTSRLCKKMLSVEIRSVFEKFVWNISDHPQFEFLVFPSFIKFFESNFDCKSLELLTKIILKKSPLCKDYRTFASWKTFPLPFKKLETRQRISECLSNFSVEGLENYKEFLLAVIVLPHVVNFDFDNTKILLQNFSLDLATSLSNIENENDIQRRLFMILVMIENLFHISSNNEDDFNKKITDCILLYCSQEKYITGLKILNLTLADSLQGNKTLITNDFFEKVQTKISSNLYSPHQEMRLISAHTLNLFNSVNNLSLNGIYEIFYKVECIQPTVHTYREQILLMEKISPDGEFLKSIKDVKVKMDCLKFLIGLLYYNFQFIWDPTLKLIESMAISTFSVDEFWTVYKIKLEETAEIINNEKDDPLDLQSNLNLDNGILQEIFNQELNVPIKVDYFNFRNLLWSKLGNLGQVSEIKNRDIVTIFLKFINQEYQVFQEQKILKWNLLDEQKLRTGDLYGDGEEQNHLSKNKRKNLKSGDKSLKTVISTLCTKLLVFTKQSNPKQLYREQELFILYLDLISGSNPHLQKIALDCILAYKNKSVLPYKDHLYGLIDEKRFKDELINFKIDKESNAIAMEHRSEIMKILLRILYGKMTTKSTAKNMSNQVRKGIILRFLGGCEKDEIFWFLKMAFDLYGNILTTGSLNEIVNNIDQDFNLETVWSAKKLQSTINLLELIHKNFGGLMDSEFLSYMLKIITFVGLYCQKVLDSTDKLNNIKISQVFKNVKTIALQSLIHFFQHFEDFDWNNEQIDILCKIFVWPNLEKLPQDSIHSPTPLLKLFYVWSENPKHFSFLIKENSIGLIPFKYIVDLLLNEKAKPIIRKTIMEMIERILTKGQIENNEIDSCNIGVTIIKPYLGKILKRLKMNFSQKGAKRKLDKRDLNILSILTNLVDDPDTCDSLLQLLLPILIAKSQSTASDEIVCQVITTLSNLINKLENPECYIRKIGPLFVEIKDVGARKMLCTLLKDIASKYGSEKNDMLELAKIINELNAWDKRWIEQPDYDKRITAIKFVTKKLDENSVSMDLGLLVIYNCFYILKHDKDMGLRDNASELLKMLVPKLVERYKYSRKDVDFLISEVLLDLVRKTIRDNNDNVRYEGILLLGEMSNACNLFHPILKDLSLLGDQIDKDNDFFENITHLQSHRHGKALLRFCSIAKTFKEIPNFKTLTQFLLPLASRYLLTEKYAGKHALIDAAVEAIGTICRLLPWNHYQAILKFYLRKMRSNNEFQKQAVRIVVIILDAFHFDLSNSEIDKKELENLKNEFGLKNDNKLNPNKEIKNEIENASVEIVNGLKSEKQNEEDHSDNDDDEEAEEIKDEYLDEELDAISENEKENLNPLPKVKEESIFNQNIILAPSAAKKVINTIATILIPTLNYSITEQSSYDTKHKLNRKRYSMEREEEEILRVPIALALVKLLQKLPKDILETSVSGVFMKVCTFLKSPLKSVRMLTRDILKKIMITLGSGYLSMLLQQLTSLLTRGFQVHVLSVTVHGVLDALKEQFKPGDIESSLQSILEVTLNDIFGEISAEKDVEKIGAHTPEAKPSAKSYLSLHIASRNISESCLLDLLIPFKGYLAKSHSKKVVNKIQDCFQKIVTGLVENDRISKENLLLFIYGTISESITDLLPGIEKPQLTEKEKAKIRLAKSDCLLIPEPPKFRSGFVRKTVKTNAQANAHVLIEFGLEMLHIILKRKKINDDQIQPFLNPLIPLLKDSLKSPHIRVTTFALKCFTSIWNSHYDLQNCKEMFNEIVEEIFKILHKYSTYGATKKDDNFNLVNSAFKSVVALIQHCDDYTLNTDHVAELLFYIDQDIQETDKQPIALSLLKAIVFRKIQHTELHKVMNKMQEISIISQSDYVRKEIRPILITYLMEYPLKKKIDAIVKFFTTQLNYELPTGRLSAIQILQMIIKKFPQDILIKKAEFLFLSLGTRLVNEDVPECRIAVAECVEQLIGQVDKSTKQTLFDINLMFLEKGEKPAIREMSATLCSRFIMQEKQSFWPRVKILLPTLITRLTLNNPNAAGRFVKSQNTHNSSDIEEDEYIDEVEKELGEAQKQKAIDHELIQIQNCVLKVLEFCPEALLKNDELNSTIDELAYESQKLLGYEHDWVRLNAAKILGLIISNLNFDLISQILLKQAEIDESEKTFIYLNPEGDIKSLVLDLCAQMIPGETSEQMTEEVVKIILLIANMIKEIPINIKSEKSNENEVEENDNVQRKIHLNWLIRRMRYIIHGEISKAPHSSILRSSIFNCFEGFITLLDVKLLESIAYNLLLPLVREMSEEDQNIDAKLRQQAIRVGNKIRKQIGSDVFDKLRTNIQTKLMIKRADRRKQLAMEKITDPVRAAKRKQGVQDRKKSAKKRKMDVIKGKIEGKKKRKRKMDDDIF